MPCECRSAPSGEFEHDRCGRRAHRRTLYVGQRMQEIGEPVLHRRRLELAHHGLPALPPLLEAHAEGSRDLPRHAVDIVRIDLERRIELLRRPGERGQDQDARIERVLRCNVFFGDEIYAVVQRRDQTDAGDTVEAGERGCEKPLFR